MPRSQFVRLISALVAAATLLANSQATAANDLPVYGVAEIAPVDIAFLRAEMARPDADPWAERALAIYEATRFIEGRKNTSDSALAALDSALRRMPNDLLLQGYRALWDCVSAREHWLPTAQLKHLGLCIDRLSAAIDRNPNYLPYRRMRGSASVIAPGFLGHRKQGVEDCRLVVTKSRFVAPDAYIEAWVCLAHGLAEAGDEDGARLAYKQAIGHAAGQPFFGKDTRDEIVDLGVAMTPTPMPRRVAAGPPPNDASMLSPDLSRVKPIQVLNASILANPIYLLPDRDPDVVQTQTVAGEVWAIVEKLLDQQPRTPELDLLTAFSGVVAGMAWDGRGIDLALRVAPTVQAPQYRVTADTIAAWARCVQTWQRHYSLHRIIDTSVCAIGLDRAAQAEPDNVLVAWIRASTYAQVHSVEFQREDVPRAEITRLNAQWGTSKKGLEIFKADLQSALQLLRMKDRIVRPRPVPEGEARVTERIEAWIQTGM